MPSSGKHGSFYSPVQPGAMLVRIVFWRPAFDGLTLLSLSGDFLFDPVRAKSPSAGSSGGWRWNGFSALPIGWFDGLADILRLVDDTGPGLQMFSTHKEGGDATPISHRPPRVLPVVDCFWQK